MTDFTIFISYSHQDGEECAERLNKLLGIVFPDISIFWDRNLIGGEYFWDKLREQVRLCDLFLFLVSDHAIEPASGCMREISWAFSDKRLVLPTILPSLSSDPTEIPGIPEMKGLQFIDMRKGIDHSADDLAKLFGSVYSAVVDSSPITQFHRKEMMLLYKILNQVSEQSLEDDEVGEEVYRRGFEREYSSYPMISDRVPAKVCDEVIRFMDMMFDLQEAWKSLGDDDKLRIKDTLPDNNIEYFILNVGFWPNEPGGHSGYLAFLRKLGWYTEVEFAGNGSGNTHMPVVAKYRAMLPTYSRVKYADANDRLSLHATLSVQELIEVLKSRDSVIPYSR